MLIEIVMSEWRDELRRRVKSQAEIKSTNNQKQNQPASFNIERKRYRDILRQKKKNEFNGGRKNDDFSNKVTNNIIFYIISGEKQFIHDKLLKFKCEKRKEICSAKIE